jgi:hypothetical protein
MLGLVFTEFLEMVEQAYSLDLVDELIEENNLASGGAYTSVGLYQAGEMLVLVSALSEKTGTPVDELVRAFGHHLMSRFVALYPGFFESDSGTFGFLQSIEDHIHVEVKKLYSNARLPRIDTRLSNGSTLILDYFSHRPMADLAMGLIEGAIEHFGERIVISRESFEAGQGYHERFTLVRQSQ